MKKCSKTTFRMIGFLGLAFGAGIFVTFFLPLRLLVILESAIIVAEGVLFLITK